MSHKTGRPRIYIAGPLDASALNYLQNVHRMIKGADRVRRLGFSVFVPGLDLLIALVFGDIKYDDLFSNNIPWLLAADAVYFLDGWMQSDGCQAERALAGKNRIPIFDDIDDMVRQFESRLGVSTA